MALIGENGAGKSTLMKILSGAISADRGRMRMAGRPYAPRGPVDARLAGVAMIYQELNLALDLSVEDNIMLGQEASRLGSPPPVRSKASSASGPRSARAPGAPPSGARPPLSVGAQQLVEIARALVMDARLIVFDEPTSSLTQRDVEHLFEVIRRLRDAASAIVYISHFLEEVCEVCDRYTVLRDGAVAGSGAVRDVSEAEIVSLMVGRDVDELFPTVARGLGREVLLVRSLSGRGSPKSVSLSLRRGEILGIAGLVGAGRTELLRACSRWTRSAPAA